MSYLNFINKLSSDTQKALESSSNINFELQKTKYGLKKYNDNSIGYKIIYNIDIDNDIKNNYYLIALQALINYLIESEIFQKECFFQYNFYVNHSNLRLSIFHSDKNYIENIIKNNLANELHNHIQGISRNLRNKFLEINHFPLKVKIKSIYKEYPVLISILTNIITEKKMINYTENIVDSLIRLFFLNDISIQESEKIVLTTFKSEEDPIDYLTQFNVNYPKRCAPVDNIPKVTNNIDNNIKQLFWETVERMPKKSKSKNWIHSIIFLIIIVLIIYSVPKYLEKIINFSKNNTVIDNILDLATDDLTATATNQNKTSTFFQNKRKLDTINENTLDKNEPNEPLEPNEPNEPSDINVITQNILRNFDSNLDINGIENRLKHILEETSTN